MATKARIVPERMTDEQLLHRIDVRLSEVNPDYLMPGQYPFRSRVAAYWELVALLKEARRRFMQARWC